MSVLTQESEDAAVDLKPAESDDLARFASLLPLGLYELPPESPTPALPAGLIRHYGFCLQRLDEEVSLLKFERVDERHEVAAKLHQLSCLTVAKAMPAYLAYGYSGLLIPMPYVRFKPKACEVGLVFVVQPDRVGLEWERRRKEWILYGGAEGRAASRMVNTFTECWASAARAMEEELEISFMRPFVDRKFRAYREFETPIKTEGPPTFRFEPLFAALGSRVFSLDGEGRVLQAAAMAGLREAITLPCRPFSMAEPALAQVVRSLEPFPPLDGQRCYRVHLDHGDSSLALQFGFPERQTRASYEVVAVDPDAAVAEALRRFSYWVRGSKEAQGGFDVHELDDPEVQRGLSLELPGLPG